MHVANAPSKLETTYENIVISLLSSKQVRMLYHSLLTRCASYKSPLGSDMESTDPTLENDAVEGPEVAGVDGLAISDFRLSRSVPPIQR